MNLERKKYYNYENVRQCSSIQIMFKKKKKENKTQDFGETYLRNDGCFTKRRTQKNIFKKRNGMNGLS